MACSIWSLAVTAVAPARESWRAASRRVRAHEPVAARQDSRRSPASGEMAGCQNGTAAASSPDAWSRPDRIRANWTASSSSSGPESPARNEPPAGPVSVSVNGWPCRRAQSATTSAMIRPSWPADEEHVNDLVQQTNPAIAAGLVGDLLRGQSGDEGCPRVESAAARDPAVGKRPPAVVEGFDRQRVGLRARLESRDCPLEQQLIAHRVLDAEAEKHPCLARAASGPSRADACLTGSSLAMRRASVPREPGQQLPGGPGMPGPSAGSSTIPVTAGRTTAPRCTTYHTPRQEISDAMPNDRS